MGRRRSTTIGIGLTVTALVLAGCAGGSDDDSGSDSSTPLSIYGCKPENPLVPANTNEACGGRVLDAAFAGLVRYNPDTAAPEMEMAESIESTDNTNWTIKLKAGNTFQDGTPVTSKSFIDAWNWAAYSPNGAINNYFFASFAGYADTNSEDPDGDGAQKAPAPKAKTMSGLKQVSDTEFTVALTSPQSYFPVELGYTVFSPLPESFYADPDTFAKKPIGNGPFQITEADSTTGYTLKAWSGYKGIDKPKVTDVLIKTYTTPDSAYADLVAGNLDFMDQVPAADLVNDQYSKDLPDRTSNKPVGVIDTVTAPLYGGSAYADPNVTKAISLAIDRPTITKSVFNGGRTPATGWVSPVVAGFKAGACGEFCTYDAAKAKEYLAKTTFKGPVQISYNADGGHKESYDAICNSIKNALGIACNPKPYVDLATLRADVNAKKMTFPFRTGWQMDYPSIQNFLEPLYATGASSNDGGFSDPAFDALIKKANGEEGDASYATYQQAEALLANKMSVIPLWYRAQQSGWSERVGNVKVTPFSTLDLSSITIK